MLIVLELFTAVVGIRLLFVEAVRNRFHNYATSVFLTCFVPLFCIYPVIARLAVGGAYSVQPGDNLVIDDPAIYVIYQCFCLGMLLAVFLSPRRQAETPLPDWRDKYRTTVIEQLMMVAVVSAGVFLYVRSTGLSATELISASRFEWFNNATYSPATFVVSSYLLALSPVAMLLALQNKPFRWVALVLIAELAFFGLMSKDRKWLIYIVSVSFAVTYLRNGFTITLQRRVVLLGIGAALVLAFWQIGRSVLFNYYLTGTGDVVYESQQMAINLLTKGDLPYYYNASITAINMNYNYDYNIPLALIRRQLLFFLPSSYSFGLKIEDISALFSDALGAEDATRRGNMPPGLFGLFVISFGWFGGILTCSLIPFALRAMDRFIKRSRGIGSIVLIAHLLSAVMLLLRGDDSSATYFIISSLVLFYIMRPMALSVVLGRPNPTYA